MHHSRKLDWLLPSPVTQANFQYGTRSVDVRCQHCFFISIFFVPIHFDKNILF